MQAGQVPALPSSDAPHGHGLKSLGGCDAEALYYGIEMAPDFVKARRCAFAQMADGDRSIFGGPGILMMIYANGKQVPASFVVAMKLACTIEGAPAELDGRFGHLRDRQNGLGTATDLDVCDDVTSGLMSGACSLHAERMAAVVRSAAKRAASTGLPRAETERLDRASAAFFTARERNEIDLSGTHRASLMIQERTNLEDEQVALLEKLREGSFSADAGDLKSNDAELNRAFGRLMKEAGPDAGDEVIPGTSITRSGIRATQRLWIAYRDAWVALVVKARPDIASDTWKALLTKQRTEMLLELAGEP